MTRFCIWLIERLLPRDVASPIVGDLLEQRQRGFFWTGRETIAALWQLRANGASSAAGSNQIPGRRVLSFGADLRLAARLLRRSPSFTIVSIATLGLAIGANAAIFSVIEPVLLRPLPYPSADRLAFVWERDPDGGRDNVGFPTFKDLAAGSQTIERAAVIGSWLPTLTGGVGSDASLAAACPGRISARSASRPSSAATSPRPRMLPAKPGRAARVTGCGCVASAATRRSSARGFRSTAIR